MKTLSTADHAWNGRERRKNAARFTGEHCSAFAALQALHSVCVAMDLRQEGERPTEEEYGAAMDAAAAAIVKATQVPQ